MKETQHIEFKSGFSDEVIETLTAFANTKGGKVLVGVANNGEPIKNFTIGVETIQEWLNSIKTKTQPSIIPDAEIIEIKGVDIVELSVQEFPVKPVGCRGRYFKRVKNSNHQLSVSEISDIYMQTMQYSWDAYFSRNYTINDLDFNKIKRFINKVNEIGRFSLDGTPEECLEKLKYISGDKVTNAAVLLFAKEGSTYNVHLGRFKTPSMIIDDKMLRLSLFEAVEETQKYLISQMKVAFEITGETTQRTEILEYPKAAIRELILNCLIHRDYLSPIDVQIKVFDDYITFYNPGKLYGNLTIEDLQTNNYQANARNKLIAEAFYLTGDIEKYGSGFRRIKNELDKYPTMKLVCEEVPNGFLATVSYTQQKTSTKTKVLEKVTEKVPEKVIEKVPEKVLEKVPEKVPEKVLEKVPEKVPEKVIEKVIEKVPEKVIEKVTEKVTENQQLILDNIYNNQNITIPELAKIVGISERKIRVNISKLKAKGLLERIGADKGGYWKIIKE